MRNRWRTWSLRALLALAVAALAIATMLWWQLRGSLPDLAGTRTLPGLEAQATIQRDALGTVTITADSEADAMRALGWVHAQERYFEMDLMRRLPAGELSALFGERALDTDRRHRLHRMRARVDAALAEIASERMPQLRAYTQGANAGLAALRARPWPYLLLRQQPAPWTPADSALVGFSMYFDLQDASNARELAMHRLRPHLPPALLALVAYDGSRWDAPLEGTARGDAPLPDADAVDLRRLDVTDGGSAGARSAVMSAQAPTPPLALRAVPLSPAVRGRDGGGPPAAMVRSPPAPPLAAADLAVGSNNFAVGGALTADGRALVADDMHLGLRAPNLWFRARLRYPDARAPGGRVDITGFTLPGLPAVIVGSNGHIAWGFTNSYVDTLDWQRIVPCDASVPPASGCTPLRRHAETIAIAGRAAEVLTVDDSDWGPVVHREADGSALALRWTAHLPGALNFGLADFAHARDLDDALAIADRTATPTQNLVIGDLHGAVAWRLLGPVPVRAPGCNGRTVSHPPGAGASGDAGNVCAPWPIATDTSPIVRTPDATRLWTANSRVVDGADFARLGDGGAALGIRAWQIRQGLDARNRFSERDLLAIQLDDRALLLTQWQALLVRAADAAGADATALRALADASGDWRGRAAVDSVAYRIVRAWRLAVHARIADGLLAPTRAAAGDAIAWPDPPNFEGVVWPLVRQRPEHLLPRRFACTPQTQQGRCTPVADGWTALLEDAAREVRDTLQAEGPLAQRTWGEHNTAAICHPLATAIPLIGRRALCMPAQPLPGDGTVPRVQAPAFGASQRMVVAPGHEADGIAHMPGGQSGHPLSPFWGAGHDDWVQGRASPFLPGPATHVLQLQPAHRTASPDAARRD